MIRLGSPGHGSLPFRSALLAPLAALGPVLAGTSQGAELVAGETLSLELRGAAVQLAFESLSEGRCRVWVSSEEVDPRLVVAHEGGSHIGTDEDGGGGTTAYLEFASAPGQRFVVTIEAEDGSRGAVAVRAVLCPETPATRALVTRAKEVRVRAESLITAGRQSEARELIAPVILELEDMLAAIDSAGVADELWQQGMSAGGTLDMDLVEQAFRSVYAFWNRTLPETHVDPLTARFNFDWTLHLRGRSSEALEHFEATWQEARRRRGPEDLFVARMASTLGFLLWREGQLDRAWDLLEFYEPRLSAQLSEDDIDLLWARTYIARILQARGRIEEARALWESLLEVVESSGPGHPVRTWIQAGLAETLRELGELEAARELAEEVLAERRRLLPADHGNVLWAEAGLASVLSSQGDHARALELRERVLAARERSLSEDHLDVLYARADLAATCFHLGELDRALELQERVLEAGSHRLPADSPLLLEARGNLALTLNNLGEHERALPLQEAQLAALEATREEDDRHLRCARQNIAGTLQSLGRLSRARDLAERAVRSAERTLSEDNLELQTTRAQLAWVLHGLGDYAQQRDLLEKVVESASRTLPEESIDLTSFRGRLAHAWMHLGEFDRALELQRQALDVLEGSQGKDNTLALHARLSLAQTCSRMGQLDQAITLLEEGLELSTRRSSDSSDFSVSLRSVLVVALARAGRFEHARELAVAVLSYRERLLPDDHIFVRFGLENLGALAASEGNYALAASTVRRLLRAEQASLRNLALSQAPRELEAAALEAESRLSLGLSLALVMAAQPADAALVQECFATVEAFRAAATTAARLLVSAADDAQLLELRDRARHASRALVALAQGEGARDEIARERAVRDGAQRALLAHLGADPSSRSLLLEPSAPDLGARLSAGEAAIGYVAFRFFGSTGAEPSNWFTQSEPRLAAHVLRADGGLVLVDLGPLAAIEADVERWRGDLMAPLDRGAALEQGSRADPALESGRALRALVVDPLLPHLREARALVVALDDVLHAVPLDALPMDDGLLGGSFDISLRPTLRELLWPEREPPEGGLVVLGGASFNAVPGEDGALAAAPDEPAGDGLRADVLRGSSWDRGFGPLPFTAAEARGVAALYTEVLETGEPPLVLLERDASREALERAAPGARWLHLATHGWFVPESVRSLDEELAIDAQLGLEIGVSREERVRASSPMVLCGLALAGANRPADALGRLPGLVTAEEIAAWDLSSCELAVLSACDTNVGLRRAGQGVASLQKALHMAGARSVVTSLWKVPDEATQELMLEFYRRMWALREPKAEALWKSKQKLREARDPEGRPRYSTRDWAGWVLTGDPR